MTAALAPTAHWSPASADTGGKPQPPTATRLRPPPHG